MGEPEQYRLIVYSNPNDSKSHENRRFVRSHVTKRQHRSMKNQSCSRARRRNVDAAPAVRHPMSSVAKNMDGGLAVYVPPPAPSDTTFLNGIGLLSPQKFQPPRVFDDVGSMLSGSFHDSRNGSISSASVQDPHTVYSHHSPISYATPPPEYHNHGYAPVSAPLRTPQALPPKNDSICVPRSHLPYIGSNDDAQTAYDTASLLLKATGGITDEYELTLEAFACAKISAALQSSGPSEVLIRAIAHMAHYDQISPKRQIVSLFHHHMECLADCVHRIGGLTQLTAELQHYIMQIDHAVASFRGTQLYFPAMSALSSPS